MTAEAAKAAGLARSKVTYEQFVQHLDGQDQFVKDIGELLVGVSVHVGGDVPAGHEHGLTRWNLCGPAPSANHS